MENTLKALLKLNRPEHNNPMRLHFEEYDIVSCEYSLEKKYDKNGNIISGVHGGTINVAVLSMPTDELMAWVFDHRLFLNGEITMFNNFKGGNKNKIIFDKARCVNFKIIYEQKSNNNFVTLLSINTPYMVIGSTEFISK